VWKLDRLGRDLKHMVNTIDDLGRRDAGLKVLTDAGEQIDTTMANGRLVFSIFAASAAFEAELISEHTRAGLAAARTSGRLGRRPRRSSSTCALARCVPSCWASCPRSEPRSLKQQLLRTWIPL
jgi:DNA invertase Pin-like site-specific DNA recombinase